MRGYHGFSGTAAFVSVSYLYIHTYHAVTTATSSTTIDDCARLGPGVRIQTMDDRELRNQSDGYD